MAKTKETNLDDLLDDLPEIDLSIDDRMLVEEWMRQPVFVQNWTKLHIAAVHATDTAKAALDLMKAEMDRIIRESPADYGLSKATESTVPGAVLETPQVQQKVKAYHNAKYRQGVIAGTVAALEDRRRALQGIIELHGIDYRAAGNAPPAGVRKKKPREDVDDEE